MSLPEAPYGLAVIALLVLTSACGGAQTEAQQPARPSLQAQPAPCDPNFVFEPGTTYYFVAPDGDDSAAGSCQAPMATLQAVEGKIRGAEGVKVKAGWPSAPVTQSSTVYVRGGVYRQQEVKWHAAPVDPNKWVRVLGYPGERPIFDGEGKRSRAFYFATGFGQRTNFQISGITWRHYKVGLSVHGQREGRVVKWSGGALISDNVFEEIGDAYDQGVCAEVKKQGNGEACFGSSLVSLRKARYNVVERNVFLRGESRDSKRTFLGGSLAVMHAVYISEFSNNNVVRDNYMRLISGDPIRLRWGSSNNEIYGNHITDSGQKAFVSCWFTGDTKGAKAPCVGNTVRGNVFTFGYPLTDSKASRCADPVLEFHSSDGSKTVSSQGLIVPEGNIVLGQRPRSETIGAMTTGDLDGDGIEELIVALNYGSEFTKIVASDGKTPYLSRVIYLGASSNPGLVTALATGRFDESGRVQLVSAWQLPYPKTREEIWRGDGRSLTSGTSGAHNLGRIDTRSDWIADALAAGNFDGDGPDELVIAMHRADGTRSAIFHGDATDSRGSRIFESEGEWRVLAMASGEFDNAGREALVTSFFQKQDVGAAGTLRIYKGDGVDSAQNDLLFQAQGALANALAVSTTNSGAPYLYAAFDANEGGRSAIRYAAGANLGNFAELGGSVQSSGRITHLAPARNGGAVNASQGQTQNIVSDGTSVYYRWDQPSGRIRCSAR